tara:strand:+ start:326 stop:697 length:372 start_codon:yes stop_codon:yes gene_type:complete
MLYICSISLGEHVLTGKLKTKLKFLINLSLKWFESIDFIPSEYSEQTLLSGIPHGTIKSKYERLVVKLIENPWLEIPSLILTPTAAILESSTHTPGLPIERLPLTPNSFKVFIIVSSILKIYF